MAEIWYVGIDEENIEGKTPVYEIPLKKCLQLFDLRPGAWASPIDQLPKLKTGNPLIDNSGYIYVLIKITQDEIDSSNEGSYKEGWYKSPHTIVKTENILKEPDEDTRRRRG